jgi:hypothetical protein
MTEVYPLEKAAEACDHMMSGKARFRACDNDGKLTTDDTDQHGFISTQRCQGAEKLTRISRIDAKLN